MSSARKTTTCLGLLAWKGCPSSVASAASCVILVPKLLLLYVKVAKVPSTMAKIATTLRNSRDKLLDFSSRLLPEDRSEERSSLCMVCRQGTKSVISLHTRRHTSRGVLCLDRHYPTTRAKKPPTSETAHLTEQTNVFHTPCSSTNTNMRPLERACIVCV